MKSRSRRLLCQFVMLFNIVFQLLKPKYLEIQEAIQLGQDVVLLFWRILHHLQCNTITRKYCTLHENTTTEDKHFVFFSTLISSHHVVAVRTTLTGSSCSLTASNILPMIKLTLLQLIYSSYCIYFTG